MRRSLIITISAIIALLLVAALAFRDFGMSEEQKSSWEACKGLWEAQADAGSLGLQPIARSREARFLGKARSSLGKLEAEQRLLCRGGERAIADRNSPWVDWANYWGAGDASSLPKDGFIWSLIPNRITGGKSRGVLGALVDLEYQRMELIKFNLFDNSTFGRYSEENGSIARTWTEMRLPEGHPNFREVTIPGKSEQRCGGELVRYRNLTGICNDTRNPLMGSTNTVFARNVQFESTFPDLPVYGGEDQQALLKNRHGDRIGLHKPDPAEISRVLFTRPEAAADSCGRGQGLRQGTGAGLREAGPAADAPTLATLDSYSANAECDYQKATWMNVLAAFWIQFMTHDWFSHIDEGHNSKELMPVGSAVAEKTLVAEDGAPGTFQDRGKERLARAPKTFRNTVTGWWDASQIYGFDEVSRRRVRRDPKDPAKLLMVRRGDHPGAGEEQGYLPLMKACGTDASEPDCIANLNPAWAGQESTAFPGNFSIGLSFYHNVFAREHNQFVDHFRAQDPNSDSGLRDPAAPGTPVLYRDVTDDQLFEVARLVVAAEIAKIHTIEWTTQLLYNEPLYKAMNANWNGLLSGGDHDFLKKVLEKITLETKKGNETVANQMFSVFASGAGIFGLGSHLDEWEMTPEFYDAGPHHFGSPFNFPEEFVTVYRLHPLVPDLAELRVLENPEVVRARVPIVETFEKGSARAMTAGGLANWALSLGRQQLGALVLNNHPAFLQHLKLDHLPTELDIAALDILRDRERGVPRYNEFRRQYGLRQLTSFDDFVDQRLTKDDPERQRQEKLVGDLRTVYGQHVCDSTKIITESQLDGDHQPINDCLGHAHGEKVDNIEDVDTVVGWLAEGRRPHGFAISETQFAVFILNASRRLFSDRFFTSSFRPEFYSYLGHDWVNFNGPCAPDAMEKGRCKKQPMTESNGHEEPVSPLKRILLRTVPELEGELAGVVNVFDPWARDRGEYYSLK